jgi:hypothetical protein
LICFQFSIEWPFCSSGFYDSRSLFPVPNPWLISTIVGRK